MINKKKIVLLCLVAIILTICLVQVIRCDWQNTVSKQEKESQFSKDLVLDDFFMATPDTVNLEECRLANMVEYIAQLWRDGKSLPLELIRKAGQAAVYVESRYLGLDKAPYLVFTEENISYYDSELYQISIGKNDPAINDGQDLLRKIIHMCYHAYQENLVDMYISIDDQYKKDLLFYEASLYVDDYSFFSQKKCTYSSQIEKNAISYTIESLSEYLSQIDEYWHPTDNLPVKLE